MVPTPLQTPGLTSLLVYSRLITRYVLPRHSIQPRVKPGKTDVSLHVLSPERPTRLIYLGINRLPANKLPFGRIRQHLRYSNLPTQFAKPAGRISAIADAGTDEDS